MKAKKVCAAILITVGGVIRVAINLLLIAVLALVVFLYLIFGDFRLDNRWWENADTKTFEAQRSEKNEPMFIEVSSKKGGTRFGLNDDLKVELYFGLNPDFAPTYYEGADVWGIYVSTLPVSDPESDPKANILQTQKAIEEDYKEPHSYKMEFYEQFECDVNLVREISKEEIGKYFFHFRDRKIQIGNFFYRDISLRSYNHHETITIPYPNFPDGDDKVMKYENLGLELLGIKYDEATQKYKIAYCSNMIARVLVTKKDGVITVY